MIFCSALFLRKAFCWFSKFFCCSLTLSLVDHKTIDYTTCTASLKTFFTSDFAATNTAKCIVHNVLYVNLIYVIL